MGFCVSNEPENPFCIPAVRLFIDVLQLFSLIYEAKLAYSFFSSFTTAAWKMAKPFGLENGVFKGCWSYCRKPFGICITLALHFYWAVDVYGRKKRWNLPSHSFSTKTPAVDSLSYSLFSTIHFQPKWESEITSSNSIYLFYFEWVENSPYFTVRVQDNCTLGKVFKNLHFKRVAIQDICLHYVDRKIG